MARMVSGASRVQYNSGFGGNAAEASVQKHAIREAGDPS